MANNGNGFNAKKREAYLENIRQGQLKGKAAKNVGVDRTTVFKHARKDPEFAKAIEEAEMSLVEVVEDALYKTAVGGNVTAQQVILYNRAPDRWKDKRNLAVTGKDGGPLEIKVVYEGRDA